jgi:hypothetical protein
VRNGERAGKAELTIVLVNQQSQSLGTTASEELLGSCEPQVRHETTRGREGKAEMSIAIRKREMMMLVPAILQRALARRRITYMHSD